MKIKHIQSLEILDSRGNPTVRTFIELEDGSRHSSSVPSGASTGSHEAVELRDGDKRYFGKGVQKAVENVNSTISNEVLGMDVTYPDEIDKKMLALDGTDNKEKLGANAILSVSQAALKAAAYATKKPLWKFINEYYFQNYKPAFPRLFVNIVNGGKHAEWTFDIQEFMVVPVSNTPTEAAQVAAGIFHTLGKNLKKKGFSTLLGDEGGYSPKLSSNEEVLTTIIESAKEAGYKQKEHFDIALDCAATEWYEGGQYISHKDNSKKTPDQLVDYFLKLQKDFGIFSFEDPFSEDDWDAHKKFTQKNKDSLIVGDDLFVTNPKRIKRGIDEKAANAVLIKVNRIGSVYETVEAIKMSDEAGWKTVISHRSGETEDSLIADLAYASTSEFIKTGSMARSERLAKYNRLLEIEKGL